MDYRSVGNSQFRRGEFVEAIESYTAALAQSDCEEAVLLGNRSACYTALSMFSEAEVDARRALSLDSNSEKLYYRLFNAFKGQEKTQDASLLLRDALLMFPKSETFIKLQSQLNCHPSVKSEVAIIKSVSKNSSKSALKAKREGAILVETAPSSSYTQSEHLMAKLTRVLIKQIQRGELKLSSIRDNHHLSGVFKTLSERESMLETLFPGMSADQMHGLPQSLQGVLLLKELILDVTTIARSAASVLEGIKKRATATGESFDAESEHVLSFQIVQESLAREVVDSVRRLAKQFSKMSAKVSLALASPSCDMALANQLDEGVPEKLLEEKVAYQENFLGSDCSALVLKDLLRYSQNEKMSVVTDKMLKPILESERVKMAYVDLDSGIVEDYYPALAEAISQLHAIPYELNAKLDSKLNLSEPAKGCTILLWYKRSSGQSLRLDNTENLFSDSGIRLTCSYHILIPSETDVSRSHSSETTACRFEYCFATEDECIPVRSIDIVNDKLVMHYSTAVKNQRTEASVDYFVLMLLVHSHQ